MSTSSGMLAEVDWRKRQYASEEARAAMESYMRRESDKCKDAGERSAATKRRRRQREQHHREAKTS